MCKTPVDCLLTTLVTVVPRLTILGNSAIVASKEKETLSRQVKRDKNTLALAKEQITEIVGGRPRPHRRSRRRAPHFPEDVQQSRWRLPQNRETRSLPRNQFTIASFDMRQGSKAIDLQFKDELVGIERLDAA